MPIGTVADVVAALTAILALFAAIAAAKQAKKLYVVEVERDEDAAARKRQSQATKVFAWVAARIGSETTYGVVVVNSSDQAIYDVQVRVADAHGAERTPVTLTTLPPGSYYLGERSDSFGWEFASGLDSFEEEIRPITKSRNRLVTGMRFRDSANLVWARDEQGLLTAC
ncbi:hypothetical protein ACNPM4_02485 [Microbacterium sp. AGC62]